MQALFCQNIRCGGFLALADYLLRDGSITGHSYSTAGFHDADFLFSLSLLVQVFFCCISTRSSRLFTVTTIFCLNVESLFTAKGQDPKSWSSLEVAHFP